MRDETRRNRAIAKARGGTPPPNGSGAYWYGRKKLQHRIAEVSAPMETNRRKH